MTSASITTNPLKFIPTAKLSVLQVWMMLGQVIVASPLTQGVMDAPKHVAMINSSSMAHCVTRNAKLGIRAMVQFAGIAVQRAIKSAENFYASREKHSVKFALLRE